MEKPKKPAEMDDVELTQEGIRLTRARIAFFDCGIITEEENKELLERIAHYLFDHLKT